MRAQDQVLIEETVGEVDPSLTRLGQTMHNLVLRGGEDALVVVVLPARSQLAELGRDDPKDLGVPELLPMAATPLEERTVMHPDLAVSLQFLDQVHGDLGVIGAGDAARLQFLDPLPHRGDRHHSAVGPMDELQDDVFVELGQRL